jgi:hypothetical protein
MAGLAQRRLPPGAPVGPRGHVGRPGHGGDGVPAASDEVGDRGLRPAHVVGVDVADDGPGGGAVAGRSGGSAGRDARDAGRGEPAYERVVGARGQHQRAVGPTLQEVALDAGAVVLGADHQQHELVARARQHPGDAEGRACEEGVGEEAHARLGHHEGDGFAPTAGQRPRRAVRRIAHLVDGGLDLPADPGGNLGAAVDHPRRRGPGHAGARRDVLERAPVVPGGPHARAPPPGGDAGPTSI